MEIDDRTVFGKTARPGPSDEEIRRVSGEMPAVMEYFDRAGDDAGDGSGILLAELERKGVDLGRLEKI